MISDTYLSALKQARKDFMEGTGHPEMIIREEVLDSWRRSRAFHINAQDARCNILTQEQLQEAIAENQVLYDIASSFIDYLYQIVKGSGFMIMFADQNGHVLKLVGDADIVETAKNQDIPLTEGSCRLESVLGTNAIGTPLFSGKPIQLFAYEHYFELSSNWTCSGAPILLKDQILGVICISGSWERAHPHTLGMIMSAAEAISRQLYLTEANEHLIAMRNQLQTSIDSIHSGIVLLDADYNISYVNAITLRTLNFAKEDMLNHSYREIFPNLELEKLKENTYDFETTVCGKQEAFKCYISIKFVAPTNYSNKESFLISFRKTEYIQQLANKVMGSDAHYTFQNIIGECPALQRLKGLALKVAQGNTSVLITGERGTGKELFAQSIHNNSPHSNGPFVAINCGAIPKDLIESELFGYDSGAFTGAKKEGRAGKFELANGGTIFLDEIGDMPYEVQVRLLRVLQEKSVTRIGGKKSIPLNVRVIAATNVNLEEAIENHVFRSDLYYRLNVFSLHIPPLRERGNDIFLLTDHFLQKYQNPKSEPITKISEEVRTIFAAYTWPGNIRELENVIERCCILTSNGTLTKEALPSNMQHVLENQNQIQSENDMKTTAASSASPVVSGNLPLTDIPAENMSSVQDTFVSPTESVMNTDHITSAITAEESEKLLIIEHLKQSGGNVKKASDSLGISRRTLYRKLEKYEIDPAEIRYLTHR